MSIPHTLAPVRVGGVGLKPTKKVPLKLRRARPDGTCECRQRVTCPMAPETITGRFPILLPGRERSAAAGWSKGYRSMT
ncbi:hypothetical protein EVAR_22137_1 [Eumeta japonica]|uniref:Uncharacterized protein n=1 Tax=Eumeta variegata TaxID=151549 RepID=A0A4C1VZL8_EUMVA|nr:hypothetical protein EVAR_22137_1 [Eumeta japonica]